MNSKNPYEIVYKRHITEKAMVLQELKNAKSNRSIARCDKPKYVFIVSPSANKKEIAQAVENIYKSENIKVTAVNTICVKSKPTRKRAGQKVGRKAAFKKAIVTLEAKDNIDNV